MNPPSPSLVPAHPGTPLRPALIVHPAFTPVLPLFNARELMLAALCASLKAQVIDQATKITRLEEDKRKLTKALHRTACAGNAVPEALGMIVLAGAALAIRDTMGSQALHAYAIGSLLGMGWAVLVLVRSTLARTTPRRREHPAHIDEPGEDAVIHMPPLGEACAGEVWSEEPGAWTSEPLSHPEALTRQLNEAIHHPEAEAARRQLQATAEKLAIASALAGRRITSIPPLSADATK